jgi:hypothetical protein
MSKYDELVRMQLQKRFKSPVGVRENDETIYANVACEPLMLDLVRQIHVLQIYDCNKHNIDTIEPQPSDTKHTYLYIIDKREKFIYSSDGRLYYKGNFYTEQELQDNFGITQTPSIVYYARDGEVKCWYNPYLKLYWDVDTAQWYEVAPTYDDNPTQDVTDMDEIGAMAMFLYYNENGQPAKYASLVKGSDLHPMCFNAPNSGCFSISDLRESKVTGTWKLLTETKNTNPTSPCVVLAIKVSDNPIIDSGQNENSNNGNNNNSNNNANTNTTYTEIVEYDL